MERFERRSLSNGRFGELRTLVGKKRSSSSIGRSEKQTTIINKLREFAEKLIEENDELKKKSKIKEQQGLHIPFVNGINREVTLSFFFSTHFCCFLMSRNFKNSS